MRQVLRTGRTEPQHLNGDWILKVRQALVCRRADIVGREKQYSDQLSDIMSNLPDESELASLSLEEGLAAGIIAIEAANVDDIDDAIARIDCGHYGYCVDCGKSIPHKRLDFLPLAKRCITCEGFHERVE